MAKKVRFLIGVGPPKPKVKRSKLSKVLLGSPKRSVSQRTSPPKRSVPSFVLTLTTPESALPYSASNPPESTSVPATASVAMLAPPPVSGSDTSTPSNWNFTSPPRPPRKWSSPPNATMPAFTATASRRLSTGISLSFSAVMVCLVVEDFVSMRLSPRTSMTPISLTTFCSPKAKFSVAVAPAFTWTFWTWAS